MEQLILHLIGDYILQSHWMACEKTKRFWPAWIHACVYSLPFLLITRQHSWAYWVILLSHFAMDRYRLARYVVWAKNRLGAIRSWRFGHDVTALKIFDKYTVSQSMPPLAYCPYGYPPDVPDWLAAWLFIIADNTLHLTINYAALRWL